MPYRAEICSLVDSAIIQTTAPHCCVTTVKKKVLQTNNTLTQRDGKHPIGKVTLVYHVSNSECFNGGAGNIPSYL